MFRIKYNTTSCYHPEIYRGFFWVFFITAKFVNASKFIKEQLHFWFILRNIHKLVLVITYVITLINSPSLTISFFLVLINTTKEVEVIMFPGKWTVTV